MLLSMLFGGVLLGVLKRGNDNHESKQERRDYRNKLHEGKHRMVVDKAYVNAVTNPMIRYVTGVPSNNRFVFPKKPLDRDHANNIQRLTREAIRSGGGGESKNFLIRDKWMNSRRQMRFSRRPTMHPEFTVVEVGNTPLVQPDNFVPKQRLMFPISPVVQDILSNRFHVHAKRPK